MRVLHVTPYFAPAFRYGGPPRSILGLCRALTAAGVELEVFTTTANGDQPLAAAPNGVEYEGVRVRYFPLAWPKRYWHAEGLQSALATAAHAADVVHVHGLWNMTSWSGISSAREARTPYAISPRGMLQPEAMRRHHQMKMLAYWGIERRHLRSAALLHATSDAEKCELTHYGTAVAMIVLSSATSAVVSMTDASTGPRSDRSPSPAAPAVVVAAISKDAAICQTLRNRSVR